MAGAMGAAGSQLAASASPAAAAQDTVSPVNIKAKETMQLGKSGTQLLQSTCNEKGSIMRSEVMLQRVIYLTSTTLSASLQD